MHEVTYLFIFSLFYFEKKPILKTKRKKAPLIKVVLKNTKKKVTTPIDDY